MFIDLCTKSMKVAKKDSSLVGIFRLAQGPGSSYG